MKTAYYDYQFGILKFVYDGEILYRLEFATQIGKQNEKTEFTDKVFNEIEEYLSGKRKQFTVKYQLNGTEFQKAVWHVLETIPYGKTYTYLDVAKKINKPKAARAVGGACNKNPIGIIVPCHRVVGTNGNLTGYAGGLDIKSKLLEIESV